MSEHGRCGIRVGLNATAKRVGWTIFPLPINEYGTGMMGKNWCAAAAALLLGVCRLFAASVVDYTSLALPRPGDYTLHILSPNVLELVLINTKAPDPAHVDSWDLINANTQFQAPPPSAFFVTANGTQIAVQSVGFKRRVFYAPLSKRGLRLQNAIVLRLGAAVADGQAGGGENLSGSLWGGGTEVVGG